MWHRYHKAKMLNVVLLYLQSLDQRLKLPWRELPKAITFWIMMMWIWWRLSTWPLSPLLISQKVTYRRTPLIQTQESLGIFKYIFHNSNNIILSINTWMLCSVYLTDDVSYEVDDPRENYDDIRASGEITKAEVHDSHEHTSEIITRCPSQGEDYLVPGMNGWGKTGFHVLK